MIPGASGVAGWLASWFSPTTCSTFSSRSPCAPRLRAGVSSASRLVSPRTAPQSRCVLCKPPGSAALCASAQCTAPLCPAGVFSSLDSGLLAALQPQSSDGVSEDHESAARVASFQFGTMLTLAIPGRNRSTHTEQLPLAGRLLSLRHRVAPEVEHSASPPSLAPSLAAGIARAAGEGPPIAVLLPALSR